MGMNFVKVNAFSSGAGRFNVSENERFKILLQVQGA
jgi:hypothetical protein